MECGATTNTTERQQHVSFSVTHFVTSNRFVSKKNQNLAKFDDLKGKTVVSVSGTTNIKQLVELNLARNLGINILAVKDHAEAFLTVETDRAAAFVMDDVILAGFVSGSKDPSDYRISRSRCLSNHMASWSDATTPNSRQSSTRPWRISSRAQR